MFKLEFEQEMENGWELCVQNFKDDSKSLHLLVKRVDWLIKCIDVRKLKINGKPYDECDLPKPVSWKNAKERITKSLEIKKETKEKETKEIKELTL